MAQYTTDMSNDRSTPFLSITSLSTNITVKNRSKYTEIKLKPRFKCSVMWNLTSDMYNCVVRAIKYV